MNPFIFHSPTRICFGEGMALSAGDFVRELSASRVFLVTDNFLRSTDLVKAIIANLEETFGVSPVIYSDVPPDSDIECVNRGAQLAKAHNCDLILCIGGGSVIDTAKVINLCLTYGGDLLEHQGLNLIDRKLGPLIAMPTTAGTGSEVSFVAMVKDHQEGKKLFFGSPFLGPDMAILDPNLVLSLPPKLTAATGIDAITHGIESFVATNTNSCFTNALCLESLKILFEQLPLAYSEGSNMDARAQTLAASCMAGVAFNNSGVGVVHALAHAVGARFGTHHGMTNAVFLPHGMRFNFETSEGRFAEIAAYIGMQEQPGQAAHALIARVEELLLHLQLPSTLSQLGVPPLESEVLDELALLAGADPAIIFNPKEVSHEELIDLLKRAY
jgi:alcohol dehydrogenase class IV